MLASPIFPARRQASIVGRNELNFRVRNGNGWTLILIDTNYYFLLGKKVSKEKTFFSPYRLLNGEHFTTVQVICQVPKLKSINQMVTRTGIEPMFAA